jgi:hypothetical protein
MKTIVCSLFLTILGLAMNGCAENKEQGWRDALASRLQVYGHRNWIVIADAAYPSQCTPGVETIATNDDQFTVIKEVLNAIGGSKHVRAHVYVDKELSSVTEQDAPGIDAYRNSLRELLGERTVDAPLHEELISKVDEAAKRFNVLILKSTLTLPYTSVFLELGCGYWNDGAEMRLRERLHEK